MSHSLYEAYADLARGRGTALADTTLRARSLEGRDLLACMATGRNGDYRTLRQRLADREAGDQLDHHWLARLATVVAFGSILESDLEDSVVLFEALESRVGLSSFTPESAKVFAEVLWTQGAIAALERRMSQLPLEPDDRTIIETDLHNPYARRLGDGAESEWSRRFTRAMGFDPEEPASSISVASDRGDRRPFDGLETVDPPHVDDGPLVSVIVTTYRPEAWLETALISLLGQTWANLEILVIDDGSPPDYETILAKAEALDDRIEIVHLPKNVGTYVARNVGIEKARGEFITFQDSDDWSHPLRIERQVHPMLNEPDVVATTSTYVRTDENLVVTRLGYPLHRRNVSSLMIRTERVVSHIGFMDRVRKGADAEYLSRIQTVFPDGYRHLGPPALAVIRSVAGSVSHGEARAGWHHMGRFAYRSAFEDWHRKIDSGASPHLEQVPQGRPFPAPTSYVDGVPPASFDLVVIADWRPRDGHRVMVEELRRLSDSELNVGFGHVETFRHMSNRRREQLSEPLRELERDGRVNFVLLDEEAVADLVIVRDPTVLQFPPHEPSAWTVGALGLVRTSHLKRFYSSGDVESHARRVFGRQDGWIGERRWKRTVQNQRRVQRIRRLLG